MRYIVLDLEWNISGKKHQNKAQDSPGLNEEIIEIGAVRLDSSMEPADRFSAFVKPRYHKKMHSFIGRLTQRKTDSLEEGLSFPETIREMEAWCGEGGLAAYTLCTWSTSDSGPWLENLRHYGLLGGKTPLFLDVQRMFALAEGEPGTQRSVAYALEYFQLPLTEPFHRAENDAYYTALILKKVLEKLIAEGLLPAEPEALQRKLESWTYDPSVRTKAHVEFSARLENPSDFPAFARDIRWTCPACGVPLSRLTPWKERKRPFKLQAQGTCPEHGTVHVKITLYRDSAAAAEGRPSWRVKADLNIERPL